MADWDCQARLLIKSGEVELLLLVDLPADGPIRSLTNLIRLGAKFSPQSSELGE